MKRKYAFFLSLALLFSTAFISSILSEDDPFAGMDTGAPQQVTSGNSGVPGNEQAGAQQQAAPEAPGAPQQGAPADSAADQMAAMSAGAPQAGGSADIAASADVLLPDNPAGAGAVPGVDNGGAALPGEPAGGALPGETGAAAAPGGPELPGMGGETQSGNAPQQVKPAIQQLAPEAKESSVTTKAAVKSGPSTHKGNTKTDDIYTKSSYIGGFRHLREIMDWGIKATSKLSGDYDASKLGDNIVDTAWIEGKKDGGKKQAITFNFDEKYFIGLYEKKHNKVKIGKIMILNGFASDKATWKKYYRVRKMKVTKNKKLQFYIMLHDTMNWQTITMKKPLIIKPGDTLRAEIMDVYPETRRDNDTYAAITEFTFLGEPYGAVMEPKYVPDDLDGSK